MFAKFPRLHALGRPQGVTQPVWPPRPTKRRRLLLRIKRKNARSLLELLPN